MRKWENGTIKWYNTWQICSRINVVVQPDYRYINYICRHHDQKKYYTPNLNKMYHFAASILFYDIAQLRFLPKAICSRWSQRFSQALGFVRLDSVFFCFSPVITTILLVCSLGMYVYGKCVINVFTYSLIQSPISDFIFATSAGLFVCIMTYF